MISLGNVLARYPKAVQVPELKDEATQAALIIAQKSGGKEENVRELLGKIVAGSAPADKLADTTEAIAKGASDAVGDFAKPVPGGHTRAEAWSNNADFNRRMAAFARDSAAMAKAGKTGGTSASTIIPA